MTDASDNTNGTSILARVGKFSWTFFVIALVGGPLGSYFLFRQDMTVAIATVQLQITQSQTELAEIKKTLTDMVPRQVHDVRNEMQKEVDTCKEQLMEERTKSNTEMIKRIEEELHLVRSGK